MEIQIESWIGSERLFAVIEPINGLRLEVTVREVYIWLSPWWPGLTLNHYPFSPLQLLS